MHLVSATVAITSLSVNPRNCLFRLTLQQTGAVTGGTGQFTAATGSFTNTVNGQGIAPRSPDGSCAIMQPALHEVDMIALSGTLSF